MPSKKIIVLAAISLSICSLANARERPITSCEKAPYLAKVREQLPSYILDSEATTPSKNKNKLKFKPGRLLQGAGGLVCVIMAVNSAGKVQDAIVIYPASVALTPQQREEILAFEMTPAELNGVPVDSLSMMSITSN